MKKLIFLMVTFSVSLLLILPGGQIANAASTQVPDELIVRHNGLEWVWASPCSGGCSQPSPSLASGGWRFATDAEFSLRPPASAFAAPGWSEPPNGSCYPEHSRKPCLCAAQFFDPNYSFCDGNDLNAGLVVNTYNGGNWEMFFVRNGQSADIDSDGVPDDTDNCPAEYNPDQSNSDGDVIGDACDRCPLDPDNDVDGDGVCGEVDNCPHAGNPGQEDSDNDGIGDACNIGIDSDGDEWADVFDNCPSYPNSGQADGDNDSVGDACDICPSDPGRRIPTRMARAMPVMQMTIMTESKILLLTIVLSHRMPIRQTLIWMAKAMPVIWTLMETGLPMRPNNAPTPRPML